MKSTVGAFLFAIYLLPLEKQFSLN